jgi:integrase
MGSGTRALFRRDTLSRWQPQEKAFPAAAGSATLVDSGDRENRPKNVILGAAFDEYRRYSKGHHRSHKKFIEPVLKFWETEFGRNLPLAKITTAKIEQVKLRRIQEVAPATVDKSLSVLKAFFSWCEHQGIFNHNPIRKVKLFNANNERIRYLSDEEYERLLTEAEKIRWYLRPMIVLAVHTGLRRGNLLKLRWDHIDFVTRRIRLTDSTKNRRTLALPLNDTRSKFWRRCGKRAASPNMSFLILRVSSRAKRFRM